MQSYPDESDEATTPEAKKSNVWVPVIGTVAAGVLTTVVLRALPHLLRRNPIVGTLVKGGGVLAVSLITKALESKNEEGRPYWQWALEQYGKSRAASPKRSVNSKN